MKARREVRWERMFPHELEAAFAAVPAIYFAYGLCEPHGPQNALGLDGLKAHGLAVRAARRHGGIVAPADFWHVHELGGYAIWAEREIGEARPWLTAVPPWVHFKNVCYHVRAAEVLGFHAAILLTGHYGPNYLDLRTLVDWLQPLTRMRLYGLPDFEANPGFPGDGADGDHAGKVETSQLWALEPACVDPGRLDSAPPGERFAQGADAAKASRPSRLRTFDDVETFWEQTVRPELAAFKSMQPTWYEKAAPDAESRWRENWRVRGLS